MPVAERPANATNSAPNARRDAERWVLRRAVGVGIGVRARALVGMRASVTCSPAVSARRLWIDLIDRLISRRFDSIRFKSRARYFSFFGLILDVSIRSGASARWSSSDWFDPSRARARARGLIVSITGARRRECRFDNTDTRRRRERSRICKICTDRSVSTVWNHRGGGSARRPSRDAHRGVHAKHGGPRVRTRRQKLAVLEPHAADDEDKLLQSASSRTERERHRRRDERVYERVQRLAAHRAAMTPIAIGPAFPNVSAKNRLHSSRNASAPCVASVSPSFIDSNRSRASPAKSPPTSPSRQYIHPSSPHRARARLTAFLARRAPRRDAPSPAPSSSPVDRAISTPCDDWTSRGRRVPAGGLFHRSRLTARFVNHHVPPPLTTRDCNLRFWVLSSKRDRARVPRAR